MGKAISKAIVKKLLSMMINIYCSAKGSNNKYFIKFIIRTDLFPGLLSQKHLQPTMHDTLHTAYDLRDEVTKK